MKIYRALYTNWKTQGFGIENTSPTALSIYQSLGLLGHNGWDWAAGDGQKIHWDCDIEGEVLNTHTDNKGGLGVEIASQDKDGTFVHRFWHLKSFACQAGQKLESGDLIGYADNTGYSLGPHLHRDLKKAKKDAFGNYETIDRDNGYFGCIDLTPYFTNIFIKDWMDALQKQITLLQSLLGLWKLLLSIRIKVAKK